MSSKEQPVRGVAEPTFRRVGVGVVALVLAVAGVLSTVAPASAHDFLRSSVPPAGGEVPVPPAEVALVLDQEPLALGTAVQVTGPDGSVVSEGAPVLDGSTVTQPLRRGLPGGAYAVAWRVTSQDGHPITGELGFTATTAATGAPSSPSVESPSVEPPVSSGQAPSPSDPQPTAAAEVGPSAPLLLGGGLLVLSALVGAAFLVLRRRNPDAPP